MGDVAKEEKGRKIVVAVDETDESMYALKWCLSNIFLRYNNENYQDALYILHVKRVVYPPFHDPSAYPMSHDVLKSMDIRDTEMGRWVMTKAEKLCQEHNVKMEGKVVEGDPRDVICDMVKKLEADLLVMGTHGYGPLTRTILGSVSTHCVQNASCPVLVVKMPKSTA